MTLEYLHLSAGSALPPLRDAPFRAVVVVEQEVTHEWREQVSKWLVAGGCLYMMAWGQDCSLWDDSVDYANLDEFAYGDIPEDRFVMTTWHEKQSLSDVFWFAEHCASHSTIELEAIVILDIVPVSREAEMLAHYERAIGECAL